MSARILVRQPARCFDAIQDVVGNVEGEIKTLPVVFHIPSEGEILGIASWTELWDPAGVGEGRRVIPLAGLNHSVENGSSAGTGVQLARELTGSKRETDKQKRKPNHGVRRV